MSKASDKVKVKQIGSPIRRDRKQRLYLSSLGLRKMNQVRTLERSDSVVALIKKVPHLVKVVD